MRVARAPSAGKAPAARQRGHVRVTLTHRAAPTVAEDPHSTDADLVVLSHLRWDWVWQRPQQVISRLARQRRAWVVEVPRRAEVTEPTLRCAHTPHVQRVWL